MKKHYIWYSQEQVDALTDVLFMQRHTAQPTFNGKAPWAPVNAGLADGQPVLYSATTETETPPPGHDDWELVSLAHVFKCLVSTSEGLTEDGKLYAAGNGLEQTPWAVLDRIEATVKPSRSPLLRPSPV